MTGRWVHISVQDTGIGIKQEDMAKLFQDFAQATARISGQYGGTGLGLALCQKFCIFLGGRIGVTSTFGRGTCFDVSPCRPPSRTQVTGEAPRSTDEADEDFEDLE